MSNYTDKELLSFAARASGLSLLHPDKDGDEYLLSYGKSWDPLNDDGDALRLAVKLDMRVDGQGAWICVEVMGESVSEDARQDPYAATRRAIVRAAAAIGEKL